MHPTPSSPGSSEELILYPSKIKWITVLLGSIGLFWFYLLTRDGNPDMHGLLLILGMASIAGMATCLVALWPDSTWLKLNPEGIHYRVLFRRFHYRWRDIKRFGIVTVQMRYSKEKFVSFWIGPNEKLVSFHDSFGKKPEHLLEILENQWKCYAEHES